MFGGTQDYANVSLALAVPTGPGVAVTVIDDRPYVLSGDESPSFVGTMVGRYRNTVGVATASGRPLAEELTQAVVRGLEAEGAAATGVTLAEGTAEPEALSALAAAGAERLLVVRLRDWRSDAQVRVTARWDLEARVYDRAGGLLGQRTARGAETIGTVGFEGESGELVVGTLSRRLADLLNYPAVSAALGPA